ncbi:MAG: hypothetical protein SH808_01685 [Saprospiraceae bacterium]|nr:hypothetical protein [Saprospiraceae bacterium]
MDQTDILNIWKAYDKKLEETLSLNRQLTVEVTRLKTKSLLKSMTPIKGFTLLVGMGWVTAGTIIISNLFRYAYDSVSPFFLISATIQIGLTAIALGIYLYQLVLIHHVDISNTLLKTQKRLANLKSSTLWSARILFLQLPVWTTFYLSQDMFQSGNLAYIIINCAVTLVALAISLWLFVHIRYANREKKWFKYIFEGREWSPVIRAMELNDEIKSFERE